MNPMPKDDFTLDTLDGLRQALAHYVWSSQRISSGNSGSTFRIAPFTCGSFFCRRCGGYRRVKIEPDGVFYLQATWRIGMGLCLSVGEGQKSRHMLVPATFLYTCVMCDAMWSVLVYPSPAGLQLALFPASVDGGVATANTPAGVAFYLDQAARCHSVSAHSAAITMFRSALEWLLLDQGFDQKELGPKLKALEGAITTGKAPKWSTDLDPEFLDVIRKLGNTATHTNAGDLRKQDQIDADLYRNVETTFVELLELIYENPKRREKRLLDLKKPVSTTG